MSPDLDLRRFPALPLAGAAAAGVFAALYIRVPPHWWLILCGVAVLITIVWTWRRGVGLATHVLLIASLALLGALRASDSLDREARRATARFAACCDSIQITGQAVESATEGTLSWSVPIRHASLISDSDVVSCGALRIRVVADSSVLIGLRAGDRICAWGRVALPWENSSGSVGSLIASVVQGDAGSVFVRPGKVIVEPRNGYWFPRAMDRLRSWIRHCFGSNLSEDAAALCNALVLGERGEFSPVFADRLRLTGLSHLFALSGMNVGFVLAIAWVLLTALCLPRVSRLCILLLVALFYMELGHEAPSLVRASLMAAVFIAGRLLHRNPNVVNTVFAAALIELLWRPLDVVDAGFLLSYSAVLGIIGSFATIRSRLLLLGSRVANPMARAAVDVLATTIAAQIGTLPLVAFLFHRVPLIGALGNIVAVPAFGIFLFWSVLLLGTAALAPMLIPLVAGPLDLAAWALGSFVKSLASVPLASATITSVSAWLLIVVYACILALGLAVALNRRTWAIAVALALAGLVVWPLPFRGESPRCTMSFISVGNGDATIITTPRNRHVLVDAGPRYEGWSAGESILRFLADRRVDRLDAFILTHADADHVGGGRDVLARIPVERVIMNGVDSSSRASLETALAVSASGVPTATFRAGDVMRLDDDCRLLVLSPDAALASSSADDNQRSLVLRLEACGSTALLTADIDSAAESWLLPWNSLLDVGLLKVAHHGSKTSSSEPFLCRVSPEISVISSGRRNPYGHPHPSVVQRLRDVGSDVYVTATDGTLTFAATAGGWRLQESEGRKLSRAWGLQDA